MWTEEGCSNCELLTFLMKVLLAFAAVDAELPACSDERGGKPGADCLLSGAAWGPRGWALNELAQPLLILEEWLLK